MVWGASIIVATGLFLVCGCQPDGDNFVYRHMTENQKVEAKQRWDAIRGKVKLQLVEQHLAAGRLGEAEKALEQALALAPRTAEVYLLAARLRLEQGQLAKAREAIALAAAMSDGWEGERPGEPRLGRSLALPRIDPEIDYLAGIIAERYGDMDAALDHYSAAARRAPNVAAYLLAEAETLIATGRLVETIALLEPRLEDFDGEPAVMMLAAQVYRMLGLRTPAAEQCRKLLRGNDDPELCAEAGLILSWAGRHAEVIAVLRPLVASRPSGRVAPPEPRPSGRAVGGRASRRAGSAGASPSRRGSDEVPAATDSPAPAVIHALARAYLETRQYREALWAAKLVMSIDEHDVTAWTLYARAAAMSGDLEEATAALTAFHQNNAPTPETLLLAAYVALQREDYAETIRAASQARELEPNLAEADGLIFLSLDDEPAGGTP